MERFTTLRSEAGLAALATATGLLGVDGPAGSDPLVQAQALRSAGIDADLAATALTQARLRRHAAAKFGADAAVMFFTRAGLEQATRYPVARRRADRLAAAGATWVADLGCGIGADTVAFARAGLRVLAVDSDPGTAEVTRANVAALGLADRVEVLVGDATEVPLDQVDAVFCDPARRGVDGRRVFDPARYSPPWSFVSTLPGRVPATVVKVAPGIDHALLPAGTEGEWLSVGGEVVEACLWFGPLARVPRRASVLTPAGPVAGPGAGSAADLGVAELTGTGDEAAPVAPVRGYLCDPDGAVVRAHLVAEFAALVDGTLADPSIAYVYADAPVPSPFTARWYQVVEVLPIAVKRLRAALRERGIGRLEIRKRGSALDVERLRRDLRLSGEHPATLVLTRVTGAPTVLLCQPVPAPSEERRPARGSCSAGTQDGV